MLTIPPQPPRDARYGLRDDASLSYQGFTMRPQLQAEPAVGPRRVVSMGVTTVAPLPVPFCRIPLLRDAIRAWY
jgi:hypothetical protein